MPVIPLDRPPPRTLCCRLFAAAHTQPALSDLPGSLRLVFDISHVGQRWFEFRLLRKGSQGELWLDEEPVSFCLVCV